MLEGYYSPVEMGISAPTSPRLDPKSLNTKISIDTQKENNITTSNTFSFEKKIDTYQQKSKEAATETEIGIKQKEIQIPPNDFATPEKNLSTTIEANTKKLNNINLEELKNLEASVNNFKGEKENNQNLLIKEEEKECNLKAKKLSLDLEQATRDMIYRKFSCDSFLQGESKIKICKESDLALDSSLPNFLNLRKIELSDCWNTISKAKEKLEEIFMENKINKEDFFKDPWKVLSSNNLAIKYGNHVYTWKVIAPIIMANLCFGQDLPDTIMKSLTQQEQGYLFWKRKNQDAYKIDIKNQINNNNITDNSNNNYSNSNSSLNTNEKDSSKISLVGANNSIANSPTKSIESKSTEDGKVVNSTDKDLNMLTRRQSIQYRKTYTLASEHVKALNLNSGKNEISFVVTNKYRGESKLTTEIYLWNYNDKIIISDLDGTITKSDVLGQVFPIFGKDWSHKGVVKLYNHLVNNGYKILYLTARALCQSDQTKSYLSKLQQGKYSISFFFLL